MKAILENNSNIRIPLSQISKINMVDKAEKEIIDNGSKTPTIKEIAEKLSLNESEVKSIIDLNKSEVSLSDPISDDESLYLSDTIEQISVIAPEEALLRKRYKETLNSDEIDMILDGRESEVIRKIKEVEEERKNTDEEQSEVDRQE